MPSDRSGRSLFIYKSSPLSFLLITLVYFPPLSIERDGTVLVLNFISDHLGEPLVWIIMGIPGLFLCIFIHFASFICLLKGLQSCFLHRVLHIDTDVGFCFVYVKLRFKCICI